jgi:hypothetical protein
MMKWKGFGRKRPWPILRYCPSIHLEGLRKTMKTLRIASLLARISTQDPLNMKQER